MPLNQPCKTSQATTITTDIGPTEIYPRLNPASKKPTPQTRNPPSFTSDSVALSTCAEVHFLPNRAIIALQGCTILGPGSVQRFRMQGLESGSGTNGLTA